VADCGEMPIFIGGINRSGTSMVRQMVGSHPRVAIPPTEFEFFKHVRVRSHARLTADQTEALVEHILGWPKVATWALDRDRVLAFAGEERSHRGVFLAFLRAYAERLRKPRIGEKTTSYEQHLATLDRWFDGRYAFVHVVRHPVASFASARWYRGSDAKVDPWAWARVWNEAVMTALRRLNANTSGYVVLRYEDVVQAPQVAMAAVCDAAGLEFDPRMLTMDDFEQRENSSFELADGVYLGPVRQHDGLVRADRVAAEELRVIRTQCRVLAGVLGYAVDDERGMVRPDIRQAPVSFRVAYATASTARLLRKVPSRVTAAWLARERQHI
jgi:hypothetical protein